MPQISPPLSTARIAARPPHYRLPEPPNKLTAAASFFVESPQGRSSPRAEVTDEIGSALSSVGARAWKPLPVRWDADAGHCVVESDSFKSRPLKKSKDGHRANTYAPLPNISPRARVPLPKTPRLTESSVHVSMPRPSLRRIQLLDVLIRNHSQAAAVSDLPTLPEPGSELNPLDEEVLRVALSDPTQALALASRHTGLSRIGKRLTPRVAAGVAQDDPQAIWREREMYELTRSLGVASIG